MIIFILEAKNRKSVYRFQISEELLWEGKIWLFRWLQQVDATVQQTSTSSPVFSQKENSSPFPMPTFPPDHSFPVFSWDLISTFLSFDLLLKTLFFISYFCSGLHKTDIHGLCHSLSSGWLFPGEDLYLKNSLLSFTLILLIPLTAVVTSDVWAFHNKQFWYLLTGVSARSHKTAPLQTPIESSCPHFCMTWL